MTISKKLSNLTGKLQKETSCSNSHPIAIYLNKLSSNSALPAPLNTHLITKQTAPLSGVETEKLFSIYATNFEKSFKETLLKETESYLDRINIDPRKRWNKIYDRNPRFKVHIQESLSDEISNNTSQLRKLNAPSLTEPTQRWNADCLLREYEQIL